MDKACTVWCLDASLTSSLMPSPYSAAGVLVFLLLLEHPPSIQLLFWGLCTCCFLCLEYFPPDIKYLLPLLPWGPCYPIRDVFFDTKPKLALLHHSSIPLLFFTLFIAPVNTCYCVMERLMCVALISCLCIEALCHTVLAKYRCTSCIC